MKNFVDRVLTILGPSWDTFRQMITSRDNPLNFVEFKGIFVMEDGRRMHNSDLEEDAMPSQHEALFSSGFQPWLGRQQSRRNTCCQKSWIPCGRLDTYNNYYGGSQDAGNYNNSGKSNFKGTRGRYNSNIRRNATHKSKYVYLTVNQERLDAAFAKAHIVGLTLARFVHFVTNFASSKWMLQLGENKIGLTL